MSGRFNPSREAAFLLAFLSGVAALMHQVLWTRRLVDLLGASSETFSKVVGAFFAGLALGAWVASRTRNDSGNFWLKVAVAEGLVAVLALPVLFSPQLGEVSHAFSRGWLKWLLPVLLVGLPAVAMGLVSPWMIRALSGSPTFRTSHAAWLYGLNTLGGLLGIAVVLLAALPVLGLTGASLGAVGLNVLVALGAWGLGWVSERQLGRAAAESRTEPSKGTPHPGLLPFGRGEGMAPSDSGLERWFAFGSGFLVLALETLLQHQYAQVTINSLFSGAVVLGVVLTGLFLAALVAPWFARLCGGELPGLGVAFLLALIFCAAEPFLFTRARGGLQILAYELPPAGYFMEVLELSALAVFPLLFCSGLVFPILLARAARDGRRVAGLFAWNGLGGWLGTEVCQNWLAPQLGLWGTMTALSGLYGVLLMVSLRGGFRGSWGWKGAGALALGSVFLSAWYSPMLPQVQVNPEERLAAVWVGREGVVATVQSGPDDWRMLFNNSYTLGGSRAQFNQERQALLPLLLHGKPKSVATLGVATGSSVAGAVLHPGVERVEAIELSGLVLRYAEQFFAPYNRDVFQDPRVTFYHEDARWIIASRHSTYDVVVGDLFLPWRTGEGRLFALEHFRKVRQSLKPDGVFCQWLPLFQLTRPQYECIVRTFREVSPEVILLRGDFYADLPIVGLLGGRKLESLDWQAIAGQCEQLRKAGKATDPLVRHVEGIAAMVIGPLPEPTKGPVNTLANAWLEWDAGRNIIGMKTPWFIGVPMAEYVRDAHRAGKRFMPERLQAAHDAGQFCLTLEIAAKIKSPAFEAMRAQAPERIPRALQEDKGAEWKQWPMSVKPVR